MSSHTTHEANGVGVRMFAFISGNQGSIPANVRSDIVTREEKVTN